MEDILVTIACRQIKQNCVLLASLLATILLDPLVTYFLDILLSQLSGREAGVHGRAEGGVQVHLIYVQGDSARVQGMETCEIIPTKVVKPEVSCVENPTADSPSGVQLLHEEHEGAWAVVGIDTSHPQVIHALTS